MDRQWLKTEPPSLLMLPNPGPVRWAMVAEEGEVVGAVWVTVDVADRPRAGIVLAGWREPSLLLQADLGTVCLAVDPEVDADEWLAHLAASRTGTHGRLEVGEARDAVDVDEVRAALNLAA